MPQKYIQLLKLINGYIVLAVLVILFLEKHILKHTDEYLSYIENIIFKCMLEIIIN